MGAPIKQRVCAAVLREGAVLMVRHAENGRNYWTLPGGGVEAGEAPEVAAVRELREETGLAGRVVRLLYERRWAGPAGLNLAERIERCYLVETDHEAEASLGHDPELASSAQILVGIAWRPLAEVREDIQVAPVLASLPTS